MNNYHINIKKFVENTNYAEEIEVYTKKSRYSNSHMLTEPSKEIETNSLSTTLTEHEFDALRKFLISEFDK